MSAAFLLIHKIKPAPSEFETLFKAASIYLPFVPTKTQRWHDKDKQTELCVWSIFPEASRGGWFHTSKEHTLVYDGWWTEPTQAPLSQTMAQSFSDVVTTQGMDHTLLNIDGEYSLLSILNSPRGTLIQGATDHMGARHIYYGQRDGVIVLSNRSFLAAAALHEGHVPTPDPLFMGWLMSSIACPYRNQTPWANIKVAGPYDMVRVLDGQLDVFARPHDNRGAHASFSHHAQNLAGRLSLLSRLPNVDKAIALTGGKDSRAVLAGVLLAKQTNELSHAYIRAVDAHPDAKVAKHLADHYGLTFNRIEPIPFDDQLFSLIDRHNFQTELMLHAWDLKGADTQRPQLLLHGNLGELYRSHALVANALGWPGVLKKYASHAYADPNNVMTSDAIHHYSENMLSWVNDLRHEGERAIHIHDRIHRDARMHRWIGQTNLFDGIGTMSINPLNSRTLLNRYKNSSILEQRQHRIHHELICAADDWLPNQPLANARWSRLMRPVQSKQLKPVTGKILYLSRQWQAWKKQQLAIQDELVHDSCPAFDDIFDTTKVNALFVAMDKQPNTLTLKSIFGLLGIKRALTQPLTARPFTMEAPHAT